MGPTTVSLMCKHRRIFLPIQVLYHLLIALHQFSQLIKFSQGLFRTSGKRTWSQFFLPCPLGWAHQGTWHQVGAQLARLIYWTSRRTTCWPDTVHRWCCALSKRPSQFFLCHSSVGILWESRSTHNEVLLRWLGSSEEKEGFWWKRIEAVLFHSGVTSNWVVLKLPTDVIGQARNECGTVSL